jgi:outer membrane receptor for ferrienterochelin and colicins
MHRLCLFHRMLAAVVLLLVQPAVVAAQNPPPLLDLSLEDLLKIDVQHVFGASERLQPVTEAPSSVTIVTADEIARYGYRTLADILRGVRGLYVSDDRNYSFLGVRGFSKPGDFNTRVLLLINGHPVNDNVYNQAQVGSEFGIDPAMFERVEIIRGPASSLYGTGAFFAVVNVITRTGASLHGTSVAVGEGSLDTQLVRAATGQRLANGLDFAVSGTYQQSDGVQRLYFPAFDTSATNDGIAEGLDGDRVGQLYGHLAFKDVTITATYGRRAKDVPTAPYGTVFNLQEPRTRTIDRRTLVDAQYDRPVGRTRVAIRGSFDRYDYDGVYPYPGVTADDPAIINYDSGLGTRVGVEGRLTRALPARQTLTAGGEFFDNIQQDQDAHDDNSAGTKIHQSSQQRAAYVQDEIRLTDWLLVNAGLRYDGYQGLTHVTPRAAVILMPSPNHSFKYLYGQAFRAPNAYELNMYSLGMPNPNLHRESIDTHEVVWEQYASGWLRTSVSAYHYNAQQLITLEPDAEGTYGLTYINTGAVKAEGLELEAEVQLKWGVQSLASYAVQRATDVATGLSLTNSPRHLGKLRVSVPGPTTRSFSSVEFQYLSRRATPGGGTVAPQAIASVNFSQPLGRSLEMFFGARNLFNQQYADPASEEHLQNSIEQNGRTLRVGLRWTPWTR